MSEVEILHLIHDTTESLASLFGQMIAITFAMIVAVYYFLNRSRIALKIFAFLVYMIGMALYFFLMVVQGNVHLAAINALKALPSDGLSAPSLMYLALDKSIVSVTTTILMNGAIHVLWIGVFYLLFFWKKEAHIPASES